MKVKLISLVSSHSEPNPDFYDKYVVLKTTYFDYMTRIVAMHWMKQRCCLLWQCGTWTTEN
jgi:hypothetical protein